MGGCGDPDERIPTLEWDVVIRENAMRRAIKIFVLSGIDRPQKSNQS